MTNAFIIAAVFGGCLASAEIASDYDAELRTGLEGTSYQLGERFNVPDHLNLEKYTTIDWKELCIKHSDGKCVLGAGLRTSFVGFSGFRSTNLQLTSVDSHESALCSLRNFEYCRRVDSRVALRMENLIAETQAELYIEVFGRKLSLEGNLFIDFENIQGSMPMSAKHSSILHKECRVEEPWIEGPPTFDSFDYDGIRFDFDFGPFLSATAEATENEYKAAIYEAFAPNKVTAETNQTKNLIGNLFETIVRQISSLVRFSIDEPAEICAA